MGRPTMPGIRAMTDIPYGYCHCGCGQKTNIAKITNRKCGHEKGKPYTYLLGHAIRVNTNRKGYYLVGYEIKDCGYDTPCWVWRHDIKAPYPMSNGRRVYRILYEQKYGSLPKGTQSHHKCRNKRCVNPDHIQPLSPQKHGEIHGGDARGVVRMGNDVIGKKLTLTQAQEIRKLYASREYTHRKLANMYGIVHSCVLQILHNQIWKE